VSQSLGRQPPPEALLDIYLALSHITDVPADSPLAPLPGEAPEETPRYYVARAAWGAWRAHIRPDIPAALRYDLAASPPERALDDPDATLALFSRHGAACHSVWLGRTARFPDDLDLALAEGVVPLPAGLDVYGEAAPSLPSGAPAATSGPPAAPSSFTPRQFAIIEDGLVVSTCESSRESGRAAEAWVRTLPGWRGRGYAARVATAWALDVRRRGKEPFYSHHRDNLASAAVARTLRLIPFLDDAGYL
jgi:GNAT acetyltransferase-like protein